MSTLLCLSDICYFWSLRSPYKVKVLKFVVSAFLCLIHLLSTYHLVVLGIQRQTCLVTGPFARLLAHVWISSKTAWGMKELLNPWENSVL